jgi:hypothetical protein
MSDNVNWNSVQVYGRHSCFVSLSLQAEEEAEEMPHDVATALRSDIAALQYKRDRLLSEVRIFPWKNKSLGIKEPTDSRL